MLVALAMGLEFALFDCLPIHAESSEFGTLFRRLLFVHALLGTRESEYSSPL
jgi:hypothetical protein